MIKIAAIKCHPDVVEVFDCPFDFSLADLVTVPKHEPLVEQI